MSELNTLFRKRIGLQKNEKIIFENLDNILEKTAKTIPFENLCIISNQTSDITRENLIHKVLVKNEGGLCYELNSILNFFLAENGFNVFLVRGVIYNNVTREWLTLGRTHAANLLMYEDQMYLIDTGFGGNLPLKPVPLNGESVTSDSGEFWIKKVDNEHGDYILEIKMRHKDTIWRTGYAFDSKLPVKDVSEFDEIQKILIESQDSPFNKSPLITRRTNTGNIMLTDTSYTQWRDGKELKEKIDNRRFKEIKKQHFGLNN
ncbi:arylamine N-acetyltransferase family protein [Bacillus sp. UMB0893]|uniref:arylamine N-acetyltransferase family protein n=1 Tax=Bacillus sp. UMB0893 TaxID=2066053 RepID=UPI000C78B933|nr:arylamine N-acetyltransferase [Bacillus sp. UMB0893]PLR66280.1 arylamine N-acetyltransferase [Bacillus sp. UMB0893]